MSKQQLDKPSGQAHIFVQHIPAVILYPSLLTPAFLENDKPVQILLLGQPQFKIEPIHVALQLKIDFSISAHKTFHKFPLDIGHLKVEKAGNLSDAATILQTHSSPSETQFWGQVHEMALKQFKDAELTKLYRVTIQPEAFKMVHQKVKGKPLDMNKHFACNLIWLRGHPVAPGAIGKQGLHEEYPVNKSEAMEHEEGTTGIIYHLDEQGILLDGKVYEEAQDFLMLKHLTRLTGKSLAIPKESKYATFSAHHKYHNAFFGFPNGNPNLYINVNEPISAYHPVFFTPATQMNLAHVSDIHLCARQHLFAKSPARVIEYYTETDKGKKTEEDLAVSPKIGSRVNISLDRLRSVLNKAGNDPDIHAVVVGGDLIDFHQSLFTMKQAKKIPDIWKLVDVVAKGWDSRYVYATDMISFYSVMIDFIRTYQKPILAVSGNHDAYDKPFGVAPRVGSEKGKRANEGIPADHNITIYESILIFGKSYHEHKSPLFNGEKMEWYHTVFTPFENFALTRANQFFIGLGWGDEETMIRADGQGLGHLPRATSSISENQDAFLKEVLKHTNKRRTVLTSHFTFVSFLEKHPTYKDGTNDANLGKITISSSFFQWNFGDYDMGTFKQRRVDYYEKYPIDEKIIHFILTGHSHRKGLYSLEKDKAGDSVKSHMYELNAGGLAKMREDGRAGPYVILSDSVGPIPRLNLRGEFGGVGSDEPAGTKITFTADGDLNSVSAIQTGCKPRVLVSVDYWDIMQYGLPTRILGLDVIPAFTLKKTIRKRILSLGDEGIDLNLTIANDLKDILTISDIILYAKATKWHKIQLTITPTSNPAVLSAILPQVNMETFIQQFLNDTAKCFMALRFGARDSQSPNMKPYNYTDYWCFPVSIKQESVNSAFTVLEIKRNGTDPEYPDLDWYIKEFPHKYK